MKQMIDDSHLHVAALADAVPNHYTGPYHLNAFDGIFAFAHAMHAIALRIGRNDFQDGDLILQELQRVSFDGASGAVAFNAEMNRLAGYDLLGSSDSGDMTQQGFWMPDLGLMKNAETSTVGSNTPCRSVAEQLAAQAAEESAAIRRAIAFVLGTVVFLVLALWLAVAWRNKIRRSHYSTFCSYSQRDGGDSAQFLKRELDKALLYRCGLRSCSTRGKNFIDTEELDDIAPERLVTCVKSSRVFVLILSRSLLTRPWCLVRTVCLCGSWLKAREMICLT